MVINEALYFFNSMDHSLINPNQITSYDISISDDPYDTNRYFGIYHKCLFVIFSTKGSTIYFDTYVPSYLELNTCGILFYWRQKGWEPNRISIFNNLMVGNKAFPSSSWDVKRIYLSTSTYMRMNWLLSLSHIHKLSINKQK